MQYLGGKFRVAKYITPILNEALASGKPYYEPFVGGASILCGVKASERYAYDISLDLILLWQELQRGWVPPTEVSEELYQSLKHAEPSALRGFVGYGCSFSGKFFGGYARDSRGRNYALECVNSLKRKLPKITGVVFQHSSFFDLDCTGGVIYCDPPYSKTTTYKGTPSFDTVAFWDKVRELSKYNEVYVSEYVAPDDFVSVLSIPTKTDIRGKNGSIPRVEKLFTHRG